MNHTECTINFPSSQEGKGDPRGSRDHGGGEGEVQVVPAEARQPRRHHRLHRIHATQG